MKQHIPLNQWVPLPSNYSHFHTQNLGVSPDKSAYMFSYLLFGFGGGELNDDPNADPKSNSRIDVTSVQP